MYKEIFIEFLRLGCIAFGGPAAHVSMMHDRFVVEKKWLDDKHFLDLISLSSVIPGPSSTELVLLIGRHRGGILGLYIAGLSFILPALSMVFGLSYLYVSFVDVPEIGNILTMISPVIIAIIMYAIFKLITKVVKSYVQVLWIILAFLLALQFNQIIVFLIVGLAGGCYPILFKRNQKLNEMMSLWMIFWLFFQIGGTLYGSGYVLASYLETFFVSTNYVSIQQVVDAITVGQITPGPVFTTAGFMGYVLSGNIVGGMLGAIGIFLPGFLLITFLYKGMEYLRQAEWFKYVLMTLNAAAIALMMHVVIDLTVNDFSLMKLFLTVASFGLLLSKKISTTKLILLSIGVSILFTIT